MFSGIRAGQVFTILYYSSLQLVTTNHDTIHRSNLKYHISITRLLALHFYIPLAKIPWQIMKNGVMYRSIVFSFPWMGYQVWEVKRISPTITSVRGAVPYWFTCWTLDRQGLVRSTHTLYCVIRPRCLRPSNFDGHHGVIGCLLDSRCVLGQDTTLTVIFSFWPPRSLKWASHTEF